MSDSMWIFDTLDEARIALAAKDREIAEAVRVRGEATSELESARVAIEMMAGLVEARDREIAALREALTKVRLLIFHGPNGGGNSEALRTIDAALSASPAPDPVKRIDQAEWDRTHDEYGEAFIPNAPAPDPAEAMRAKTMEAVDRWAGRIDAAEAKTGWGDCPDGYWVASSAPDPADAMRAKCEELIWEQARCHAFNGATYDALVRLAKRITALKGNGEGTD